MKMVMKVLVLVMMLVALACGDTSTNATSPPETPADGSRVFYLGDSITLGCSAVYPEFWGDNVNMSIANATILDINDLWNNIARYGNPDAVVLLVGANEIANLSIFYTDMDNLLTDIEVPTKVVSILPTSFDSTNARIDVANIYVRDLAIAHGFDYVDLWPSMAVDGFIVPSYTTDGIQLSPEGCQAYLDSTVGVM